MYGFGSLDPYWHNQASICNFEFEFINRVCFLNRLKSLSCMSLPLSVQEQNLRRIDEFFGNKKRSVTSEVQGIDIAFYRYLLNDF